MSQFVVNVDGTVEQDQVFICDRLLNIQGQLYPIENLRTIMRLNQNDEVSFRIYKNNNGNINPFWDKIDDIAIILVEGKGYFEIAVPSTQDNCVYKEITGVSLGEAETSQTKVTLQINTDDDLVEGNNFIPTILYDENGYVPSDLDDPNKKGNIKNFSLLHRVFKSMPHYSIGHVDASVASLQRTFSCDDQPIYDFLQTVAEELECIFVFDNFKREINCYDLKDHCNRKSCITSGNYRNVKNGVCQCCNTSDYVSYGYGKDSGVYMDSENLVESVTLTGDKDSVKNCFKIEGADDVITNMLGTRLMDGNYIWKFSPYQMSQMSEPLQRALVDRAALVESYQDEYNELWDMHNEKTDKVLFYQSGMMPGEDTDETTAISVYDEIFGRSTSGKIKYACLTSQLQTASSVLSDVNKFAKLIAPKTYEVETTLTSSTTATDGSVNVISSITFSVHIYLKDAYKEDNKTLKDEYTANKTLTVKRGYNMVAGTELDADNHTVPIFSTDYYLYLQQQLEMALEKSDVSEDVIEFDPPFTNGSYSGSTTKYADYDNETNPENLSSIHYTMYSINRLKSFRDAYEACSQIIAKLNSDIASDTTSILKYVNSSGGKTSIYDDLLKKYYSYIACIDARSAYLESIVNGLNDEINTLKKRIDKIKDICNMEKFLKEYDNGIYGDDLWIELCSFKREDTYRNENYAGDGYSNTVVTENVEALIKRATEELEKACEINYSINTTVGNLLTMWEFQPLWDDFTLGNWIRIRIDEDVYRLRLIAITFDYSDLSHIEVEFSDVTKTNNPMTDIKSILQQASSMASNFNSVSRQAEKGSLTNEEFNIMKEYGLDVANMMITSADSEIPTIDNNGITCRTWDYTKNDYSDEQMRLIHNLLCFTSDAWKHTRLALGKILYYNDEKGVYEFAYGLNAEVIISNLIMSEALKIINKSGTYEINNRGFIITNGDNTIEINAETPYVKITKSNKTYFYYSPADGLYIDGQGKFSGQVLVGNSNKYILLDPTNPSMVINNGNEDVFAFNVNNDNKLYLSGIFENSEIITSKITAGDIIASKLYSDDYDRQAKQGMCIDLGEKSIEIYSDNDEILTYNLNQNKLLRILKGEIGGWKIENNKIISKTGNIILKSDGDIICYSGIYGARLVDGKMIFGTYENGTFHEKNGYADFSQKGIYAKSKDSQNNDILHPYLFEANTETDEVTIASCSKNRGLSVVNHGSGDAVYINPRNTSGNNNALHIEIPNIGTDNSLVTGHFTIFGEANDNTTTTADGKEIGRRIIFRCQDKYGEDGNYHPLIHSALGTTNYPWGQIVGYNITNKSDLKDKNVISYIDKEKALDFINALEPIKYTFKDSVSNRMHMGFGAQTVAKTAKDLNMGDLALYEASVKDYENGTEGYYSDDIPDEKLSWGLKYTEFIAPIVSSVQLLSDTVTKQNKIIDEQNEKIEDLTKRLEKLETIIQNQGLS